MAFFHYFFYVSYDPNVFVEDSYLTTSMSGSFWICPSEGLRVMKNTSFSMNVGGIFWWSLQKWKIVKICCFLIILFGRLIICYFPPSYIPCLLCKCLSVKSHLHNKTRIISCSYPETSNSVAILLKRKFFNRLLSSWPVRLC